MFFYGSSLGRVEWELYFPSTVQHSFLIVDLQHFSKKCFFTKRLQNRPLDLSRPPSGAKFRDLADDRRQTNQNREKKIKKDDLEMRRIGNEKD